MSNSFLNTLLSDEEIRNKYVPAWNRLIVDEKDKYRIAAAIHRQVVHYAIDITGEANAGASGSFLNDAAVEGVNRDKIAKLISAYDFKKNTGIGLLFFVETLNKEAGYASMWVTFVDMDTKEVLLAKRMKGKVGGFGFRNYWAKAYYLVIEDIGTQWRSWAHEKSK